MKIKPKEIMLNVPTVLTFHEGEDPAAMASNINALIHGKVKVKYDELGMLGDKSVVIFYLQRNDEYHELREEFREMIESEEVEKAWLDAPPTEEEQAAFDNSDVGKSEPW